jgi:PGF-pre-PGF domain-containing protein
MLIEKRILLNALAITAILLASLSFSPRQYYYYPPPMIERVVEVSFGKGVGTVSVGEARTIAFTPEEVGATSLLTVNITARKTAGNVSIVVFKLSEKPAEVPQPPVHACAAFLYLDPMNLAPEDAEVSISFRVSRNWVAQNEIDEATITLLRFYENAWQSLPTQLVGRNDKYLYFTARSPGLSLFAIGGLKRPAMPWGYLFVASAAAIIIIGVAILYLRLKRRPLVSIRSPINP